MPLATALAFAAAAALPPGVEPPPDVEPPPARAFLTLSVERVRRPGPARIHVAAAAEGGEYWFRRESSWYRRESSWTTLSLCPGAALPLQRLMTGTDPTLDLAVEPPPAGIPVVADGATYRLEGNLGGAGGQSGRVELQGRSGTPLAATVETFIMLLEPCWRDVAAAGGPDFSQLWVFATLSVSRSFEDHTTTIRIGTFEGNMGGRASEFWILGSAVGGLGAATTERVNTRDCPAALHVLERLEGLRMPQPDVIRWGRDANLIVTDGASYVLEGRARHPRGYVGDYRITSNVGTPLARWAEDLLAALAPCWRSAPPD